MHIVRIFFILFSLWVVPHGQEAQSVNQPSQGSNSHPGNDHLKHLHILFRHGDRSPINSLPAIFPNFSAVWPQGFGQLTNIGTQQHFMLGKWLRSKYEGFVPTKYNGSYYHVRSTDVDRTLMSAMANSAGFYNSSYSPLTDYGVNWSPVPVHTKPQITDALLGVSPCPRRDKLQQQQMDSLSSVEFEKKHSELFSKLTNVSGIGQVNRHNIWLISDFITCMTAHNITLPDWCTKELLADLDEVSKFYWVKKFTSSSDIIRLEIGVFLDSFVKHVRSIINGGKVDMLGEHPLSTNHIMVYSAHDTDVTYLLAGFGVYDNQTVHYASTVILELYGPEKSDEESDFSLKLLYKRGWTDKKGEYLTFPVCKEKNITSGCPVNLVFEQIKPLLIDRKSFYDACSFDESNSNYPLHPVLLVFIGALISTVLLLTLFWYYTFRLRRYHSLDVMEQPIL
ncbi:unnamed protein product [Heterobilharzia americana]|nr:unnamed protein product [Heterobilharzia americana]